MSLYDYPELYATLLFPEPELLEATLDWLDEHLVGASQSMFDPCAGPATWILPFAARGYRVAGNDLSPKMIAEAERRLRDLEPEEPYELTVGDMCDLKFASQSFDFAINFHASVGHLPGEAEVIRHLKSVASHLRPGGIYIFGIIVNDGKSVEEEPESLYESDMLALPSGGMAACHYTSRRRDHQKGEEIIEVLALTTGSKTIPERIVDRYMLKTYAVDRWRAMLEAAGSFDLVQVHSMADDRYLKTTLNPKARDLTLILRRKG